MIKRRNKTYHCDFVVHGQRVRQSLDTTDWREATRRESELKAQAREGKLAGGTSANFSRLAFGHAVERYLAELTLHRPDSVRWERDLTNRLREFFFVPHLSQISADDIRQYQTHRIGQGKHPNTVNHEVKALLRLLKRAKLASRLRDDVKLLTVVRTAPDADAGRKVTPVRNGFHQSTMGAGLRGHAADQPHHHAAQGTQAAALGRSRCLRPADHRAAVQDRCGHAGHSPER
jgi:hypothetical protein